MSKTLCTFALFLPLILKQHSENYVHYQGQANSDHLGSQHKKRLRYAYLNCASQGAGTKYLYYTINKLKKTSADIGRRKNTNCLEKP